MSVVIRDHEDAVAARERESDRLAREHVEQARAEARARRQAAEPGDLDLEAVERDAKQRLSELRLQRLRLAPESLTDSRVAAELADVESEIQTCERTLERIPLAREEQERRAAEAAKLAELRAPILDEARQLAARREQAARKVDKAAAEYAKALAAWDRLTSEQESVLRRAGRNGQAVRPRPWMIESGLLHALTSAGVPHGAIGLEIVRGVQPTLRPGAVRPLAEFDGPLARSQLGGGT
jgi:hypothetical protein